MTHFEKLKSVMKETLIEMEDSTGDEWWSVMEDFKRVVLAQALKEIEEEME